MSTVNSLSVLGSASGRKKNAHRQPEERWKVQYICCVSRFIPCSCVVQLADNGMGEISPRIAEAELQDMTHVGSHDWVPSGWDSGLIDVAESGM
jgi:hypothetical protein